MTVVVFTGPTLPAADVLEFLDAEILPPVQQGDVYRAASANVRAIGIIDGYFDGVPSVWHKEILWAMEQGIPVFGSASMGALRAAELVDFGMIGVGRVFQEYRSGAIQDDDEVAVLHSPAELGFKPLGTPMVSIRATVQKALDHGILQPDAAGQILNLAKALHYRQRDWNTVLEAAQDLPDLDRFRQWLPDGAVDIKAEDAREMLRLMARHSDKADGAVADPVRVERTLAWRELCARIDDAPYNNTPDHAKVLDEVRLDPKHYAGLRDRAALRLLSCEDGYQPDKEDLMRQMSDHRSEAGLPRQADLMRWLEDNDLTVQQYETLLAGRAHTEAAIAARQRQMDRAMLTELQRSGRYAELKERAASKSAASRASQSGGAEPTRRMQALIWYFETQLDRAVPDDLESYAVALGLTGRDRFFELIEAEYAFCQGNAASD
ncbi:MAG: TfuA-like protein [Ruegeria sp.]